MVNLGDLLLNHVFHFFYDEQVLYLLLEKN